MEAEKHMGTGNEKVESKPMPVGGYVKNNAGSPDTGHSASGVGAPKPGTPAPGAPTPSTTKPGEHGATKPVVPATTEKPGD